MRFRSLELDERKKLSPERISALAVVRSKALGSPIEVQRLLLTRREVRGAARDRERAKCVLATRLRR